MIFLLQIIGALLISLLLLLAIPITLIFKLDRSREINGHIRGYWLFGLLRFRVAIPGPAKAEPGPKKSSTTHKQQRKAGRDASCILNLLIQSTFRNRVVRFVKDILRACHGRALYLHLRIGLGDPADTGRLWALLGPLASVAACIRSAEIRLEPEFMEPVFVIESHGSFRLIPLQFIVLTLAFMVSPPILRTWCTLLRGNR